eukprot:6198212-Pleurochrysis_carterae.AAC.3
MLRTVVHSEHCTVGLLLNSILERFLKLFQLNFVWCFLRKVQTHSQPLRMWAMFSLHRVKSVDKVQHNRSDGEVLPNVAIRNNTYI